MRGFITYLALTMAHAAVAADATEVFFDDVNVLDIQNQIVRESVDVRVGDGVIVEVGADLEPGKGVTMVSGGYLIPGLSEMHAHIPPMSSADVDRFLTLYLSQGITVIRGMLGEPGHLQLRRQANRGAIFSPRIVTTGPSFNGRSVRSPEQAKTMVREQQEAGYDMLKIHPGLTAKEIEAVAEESKRLGIPFVGHTSYDAGLERVLALGQSTIDHLDDYVRALVPPANPARREESSFFGINFATQADRDRIEEVARWTREADAWVVPTETFIVNYAGPKSIDALANMPGLQYVPQAMRDGWEQAKRSFLGSPQYDYDSVRAFLDVRQRLLKGLQDGGVGILLGSDAPQVFNVPGFSIHQELELYVEAGLTTWQALATGTTNVARYLKDSRSGAVATGYRADVVLLGADPSKDISATRNIRGVMISGRWHDRADLDKRLRELQ